MWMPLHVFGPSVWNTSMLSEWVLKWGNSLEARTLGLLASKVENLDGKKELPQYIKLVCGTNIEQEELIESHQHGNHWFQGHLIRSPVCSDPSLAFYLAVPMAEIRKMKMKATDCVTICCIRNLSVFFFLFSFPPGGAPVYRGFWAVLMLLGVVAVVIASFLIICAAPFASHFLYKAGGGSYIAAGTYS